MSKDERSTGFLSKVARFVLHPTVSWSDLDSKLPGAGTDQDRAVLKAAIERKRRNDFVRKREFDMLRAALKERQAQQAGAEAPGRSSVFQSTGGGQGGAKEKTIEKIAQIEAQMSQHWWQNKRVDGQGDASASSLRIGPDTNGVAAQWQKTVPGHLQTRPGSTDWGDDTQGPDPEDSEWGKTLPPPVPADAMPIDMLSTINTHPGGVPKADGPVDGGAAGLAVVEEAAVRFANGETQAAEELLLTATQLEGPKGVGKAVWQAWLDCLHAKGDVAGFEDRAAEYAEVFGGREPAWPGWEPAAANLGGAAGAQAEVPWVCPVLLDRAAVDTLSQHLDRAPAVKWLDWGALVSADATAAQALLDLVDSWSGRDVVFRFAGAGVLRRRLKGSTPSGRRENDPVWWRLRLAFLRLMGRVEEFDLAALDFCVTYGVVPPTWAPTHARFEGVEAVPNPGLDMAVDAPPSVINEPIKPLVTQLGGMDVLEWPALAPDSQLMDVPDMLDPTGKAEELFAAPVLSGVLAGDVSGPLGKLDLQLRHHVPGGPFVIDCQQLLRIDFAAAGHLMQWLMGVGARGITVELRGVGRLVAAFLHVVGVDETVPVQLRKY